MKVLHLNHSDNSGGAAIAAYRIHHALRSAGVDSNFLANISTTGDWTVECPNTKIAKAWIQVRPQIGAMLTRLMDTENKIVHSPAVIPSGRLKYLNSNDADIIHLHWVQNEMLSIGDIGALQKPVVWTLHDMWAFCGAEHVSYDERWREGYQSSNRPSHESGFDLNRWTWRRKKKHWQQPLQIVTPSNWLAQCVKNSALMKDWPVTVIPNCIDTDRWKPIDQNLSRQVLGLPTGVPLLLFGTAGANAAYHKGFDLLIKALDHLRGELPEMRLVIFGQLTPQHPPDLGFPVHYFGHLHDDTSLRLLYSAVNAVVIPSRVDNFPNTAIESLACGTPIVAFDVCGLPEIVKHKHTGYLSKPFCHESLAIGIKWIIQDCEDKLLIRKLSRKHSIDRFSVSNLCANLIGLYEKIGHIYGV